MTVTSDRKEGKSGLLLTNIAKTLSYNNIIVNVDYCGCVFINFMHIMITVLSPVSRSEEGGLLNLPTSVHLFINPQ